MKTRFFILIICICAVTGFGKSKKIARFEDKSGGIHYGLVENGKIQVLSDSFDELVSGKFEKTGKTVSKEEVKLLAPVVPSKMINFGMTYNKPGQKGNVVPLVFFKPPSAIIGDGEKILYPSHLSKNVAFEAELALIIGKTCRKVDADEALDYVFAYTCHNDITARDLTGSDPSRLRGKSCDTFAPLGPVMVTGLDAGDLKIQLRQNGVLKQDASTSDMTYDIGWLVSFVSQVMTLHPGDVISTGTPPGLDRLEPGDKLEVIIEDIGTLTNTVGE